MDQVIILTNEPNQRMGMSLTVNGASLQLNVTLRYNEMINYWIMDIADANNNSVLTDIPLLTGVFPAANILGQYQYLQIGSAYVLDVSNDDVRDYPNVNDIATSFVLLWGDNV
jgi:hypothetical protein